MTATFLLNVNIGDDTDLVGISQDIQQLVEGDSRFVVLSCKPWSRQNLQAPPVTPPVVPGT